MSPTAQVLERYAERARTDLAAGRMIRGPGLSALTGITYRQLDYWVRTGLIVPTQEAHGSGTQRLYDGDAVRRIMVAKRLLDMGVSLQRVRDAMPMLGVAAQDGLRWLVITPSGTPVACVDAHAVVDVVAEAHASVVLDLFSSHISDT